MRTKNNDPGKKKKATNVVTEKQVKALKASYKATTGMEYKPKATTTKAAPRTFKSNAEKEAWFAKNAPDRAKKKK